MSRAFVKGDDSDLPDDGLPERPLGEPPFHVTRAGLGRLQARFSALQAEHARLKAAGADFERPRLLAVERDLRYLGARLDGSVVVDVAAQPRDTVHFGARVAVRDAQGRQTRYVIVGEDDADIAQGRISYRSPLARALLGATLGEHVSWQRPAGNLDLEVVAIDHEADT